MLMNQHFLCETVFMTKKEFCKIKINIKKEMLHH
jgi:hypothetical protein